MTANKKAFSLSLISFNALGVPFVTFNTPASALLKKHRKHRLTEISEQLNQSNVDIICFQEIHTYPMLRIIRKHLLNYRYVHYKKFLYGPKGGLVTFSKMPFHASEYITFYKKGSFRNKSIVGKISRKGLLISKMANAPIYILNTHLTANLDGDYSSTNRFTPYLIAQIEQVKSIIKALANFPVEIILVGDFNMPKDSEYYRSLLLSTNLVDVFDTFSSPTYHHECLPSKQKPRRIDHMFYLKNSVPIRVLQKEHIFDKKILLKNNIYSYLSDHIGLLTKLHFSFAADVE